jgi:hypothetical protein
MDRQLEKWFGFLVVGLVAAASLNASEPNADINSVLRNWEATSGDRGRDGATVRALQTFLGPLREVDLQQRFTWRRLSETEVEAIPSDHLEQQFLPSVRLALDEMGMPQSVLIGNFRHEVRDIVRSEMRKIAAREAVSSDNGIVRVSFDSNRASGGQVAITPRVSEVLTRWVAASKTTNALRATFHRVDYDSATEVETHATGAFVFSAPYTGLYHAEPVVKVAAASARIGLDGKPYTQLPAQEMMLVWDQNKLTQVDIPAHRFEVHQLPTSAKELLCGGSFDAVWQTLIAPQSALPMIVALQEKELRANYSWSLVSDDQKTIILHGTPVGGADAMLYQGAQIVIDPATFRTRATRMFDITGTKETVHEFQIQVAAADIAAVNGWQPDLSEFDRMGEIPGVEPTSYTQEASQDLPPAPPATLPAAE